MLILGIVPIIMAVAAAVGAIVSAIGIAVAAGDKAKARDLRAKAIEQYGEDIKGQLDPLIVDQIGPTEFANIAEDADVLKVQKDVMGQYGDIAENGGIGPGDRAALALANDAAASRASSDAASIQQSLAARGQQMNPTLAAAMASKASQNTVNATARNGLQMLSDARNRSYDALGKRAGLAGDIRNQDWQRNSARASAQDVNNRLNANLKWQAQQANRDNALRIAEAKLRAGGMQGDLADAQVADTARNYGAASDAAAYVGQAGQAVYDEYGRKKVP